jgi:hypothetical protein
LFSLGNKKGEDGETGWMSVQQTTITIRVQSEIFRLEILCLRLTPQL